MQTRQLGNSDLFLTPLGIGSWAMGGGGWAFAWGPQDDAESLAAIRAGIDAGMNWIDTAAVYGLGHSEELVARALEGVAQPARHPAGRPQLPQHHLHHRPARFANARRQHSRAPAQWKSRASSCAGFGPA